MRHVLASILVFPILAATAAAAAEPVVVAAPLPAPVAAAVQEHYEIGRLTWDSGGVSRIRTYSLQGFDPAAPYYLEAVVAALAEATRPTQDFDVSALAASCGIDPYEDQWDPIPEPRACARWHLEQNGLAGAGGVLPTGGLALRRTLARLAADGASADDEVRRYNAALAVLTGYLYPSAWTYEEVQTWADYYSVDVMTAVLIDRARGVAHVVDHDWGA